MKKERFLTERQMNADTLLKDGDYKSIRQILERLNAMFPDNRIFGELNRDKEIVYTTAREMYEEVMNLGDGLIAAGLKDAHIAIVSHNSVRYVLADICVSSGVGVVTPMDVDAPAELLATLTGKCDATAAFCSSKCLSKLEEVRRVCPALKTLITMDRKVEGYPFWEELTAEGRKLAEAGASVYRNIELDLEAPAKILFTSGTTGANKGVILTNANLAANIMNCMDTIKAEVGNTSMSVLPMHHATEINTHVMTRIAGGKLTYINDNMRNLMLNIRIFKPNTITIVPMIATAFYKGIWSNAEKQGKADKLRKGIKISNLLRKFGKDKTHEMFKDLYEPFGGNLSMIVCGGAMLNPVVVKGLNDIGIRLENGYGITECGPLISVNDDTLQEHLSVGRPCPSLQAKILNPDENGIGDLCIKGASVAKGYYKDDEATRKAFLEDGFFNTGDSARIDASGRIFLVGRKKNTIVLPNGKNIYPEEVENVIETNMPYASDIVVYQAVYEKGSVSTDVVCAGIFIEDEARRADHEGIAADIARINALLPDYKRINYVELPAQEYDKTSTRKIRRASLPTVCSGSGIIIA